MSSKVNVSQIINGHFKTLQNAKGKFLFWDWFTFFGLPAAAAIVGVIRSVSLNDSVSSMLVNFGAIFTALLLSVLVLVYDQEAKLDTSPQTALRPLKLQLLKELHCNISFAIVCSVVLIGVCLVHAVTKHVAFPMTLLGSTFTIRPGVFITSPLAIFITLNLFLTIIMVVKRMHTLLTTK